MYVGRYSSTYRQYVVCCMSHASQVVSICPLIAIGMIFNLTCMLVKSHFKRLDISRTGYKESVHKAIRPLSH